DVEARAEGDDVRGLDEGEAVATEGRDAERGERTGPTEERPALARQGVGPRERAAEVEPEFEAVVRERGHGHVGPRGEAAEGEVARDGGAREFESGTRGEGGERAGPLAGARGDETGDAAFVRREVRADRVVEDGPGVVCPERAGVLDLTAQAGIPRQGPACAAPAHFEVELARAVVVAVIPAGEEERERVAERVADPALVGDGDVAGAEDDRRPGLFERHVQPSSPRAPLRAIREFAVDTRVEAGHVRRP